MKKNPKTKNEKHTQKKTTLRERERERALLFRPLLSKEVIRAKTRARSDERSAGGNGTTNRNCSRHNAVEYDGKEKIDAERSREDESTPMMCAQNRIVFSLFSFCKTSLFPIVDASPIRLFGGDGSVVCLFGDEKRAPQKRSEKQKRERERESSTSDRVLSLSLSLARARKTERKTRSFKP